MNMPANDTTKTIKLGKTSACKRCAHKEHCGLILLVNTMLPVAGKIDFEAACYYFDPMKETE